MWDTLGMSLTEYSIRSKTTSGRAIYIQERKLIGHTLIIGLIKANSQPWLTKFLSFLPLQNFCLPWLVRRLSVESRLPLLVPLCSRSSCLLPQFPSALTTQLVTLNYFLPSLLFTNIFGDSSLKPQIAQWAILLSELVFPKHIHLTNPFLS